MSHSKGVIKQNKTTYRNYRMLRYLERLKSYEFLTDFVFATCCEIGASVRVVICSVADPGGGKSGHGPHPNWQWSLVPLRDRKSNGSIVILLKSKEFGPPY